MTVPRFHHSDPGVDEADWAEAIGCARTPTLELDAELLVVIAAHPDDETLGAGGLIATAIANGVPVSVVVATDGEGDAVGARKVRARRRAEAVEATNALGAPTRVVFLGVPDGGLRERVPAIRAAIAGEVDRAGGARTLLVAPWSGDGHRDHRIAGEVAGEFASATVRVAEYPIWYWHWGDPTAFAPTAWTTLPLSPKAQAAKSDALAAYRSQTEGDQPMLHSGMLAHFARPFEAFAVSGGVGDGVPSRPADDFEAFHRRHTDPWGLDSRAYESRKRDILIASLPRERFERVLEIGCAHGALTARLAEVAGRVVAVDLSPTALQRARARGIPSGNVDFLLQDVRVAWPGDHHDLVVLSEVAYYWTEDEVRDALTRAKMQLLPGGAIVLCHWRPAIADAPLTGDRVHRIAGEVLGMRRIVRHEEEAFLLDVYSDEPGSAAGAA